MNYPANLLLNTWTLPSEEIHPEDVNVLRTVSFRIFLFFPDSVGNQIL